MEPDSKIYVAGHRGLVGFSLMHRLSGAGHSNIVTRTHAELDLRDQRAVQQFFEREKPEYVFLAAAKVGGILANSTYKAEFIYDNLMIASNIIHSAYECGVKKLLNLGSSCIYPKLAPQPMKEEHLLTGSLEQTNEPYAIAKIAAIKLCRYYNEQYGTSFISVMPTNLYGPNDNFNLETAHVLPALIRKFHLAKLLAEKRYDEIKRDLQRFPVGFQSAISHDFELVLNKLGIFADRVVLWGSGEPYREFLYIDDLADACVHLMKKFDYKDIGEFVNVGSGEDIKIKELVGLAKSLVGFEGRVEFDTTKPDGTPRKLLDVSRIEMLGWKPKVSLSTGIQTTYKWYLESLKK
ncbi:MAG: GDP-L-fucose synthase [Nitrospirota bacterium]